MEIQSRPLPRFPWMVRTPDDGSLITLISLSALSTAACFYCGYSTSSINGKFFSYYASFVSALSVGIFVLSFTKWRRVARHLPIEELLPYLQRVPEREEEASSQLRALLNELILLPRFQDCLNRLDRDTSLRLFNLLNQNDLKNLVPQPTRLHSQTDQAETAQTPSNRSPSKPSIPDPSNAERSLTELLQESSREIEEIRARIEESSQRIEEISREVERNNQLLETTFSRFIATRIHRPGFDQQLEQCEPAMRMEGWALLSPEDRANAPTSTLKILLWSTSSLEERSAFWSSLTPDQQRALLESIEEMDQQIAAIKKASRSNRREDLAQLEELLSQNSRGPALLKFLSKEESMRVQEKMLVSPSFWKSIGRIRSGRCAAPRMLF